MKSRKMSIEELEELLSKEEDVAVEILPNGEVITKQRKKSNKVLTFRENLGGEY